MSQKITFKERKYWFKQSVSGISHLNNTEESRFKGFLDAYPKQIFMGMVAMIITSFLIVFLIFPHHATKPGRDLFKESSDIQSGFAQHYAEINDLTKRAARMMELKAEIERVISKDTITKDDSITVEKAIQELDYFNNKMEKEERQIEKEKHLEKQIENED